MYQQDTGSVVPKVNICAYLERPLLLFRRTPPGRTREIRDTSSKEKDKNEEESEGFCTYRIADRRGDHFDHRGYRNSELASRPYGGQSVFRGRVSSHACYLEHHVQLDLGQRFCPDAAHSWRRSRWSCNLSSRTLGRQRTSSHWPEERL